MYLRECGNCLNGASGLGGLGLDYMSMLESVGSAFSSGGSGNGGKKDGGGGTQSTAVTSTVTTSTTVSPQISPQFIQQQSPVNSGINAGINPMPGMGAPHTGSMPGFDLFPASFQQSGAGNPLLLLAGAGLLVLAGVKIYRARHAKKRGR